MIIVKKHQNVYGHTIWDETVIYANVDINNFSGNSAWFKYKQKITGKTDVNGKNKKC